MAIVSMQIIGNLLNSSVTELSQASHERLERCFVCVSRMCFNLVETGSHVTAM